MAVFANLHRYPGRYPRLHGYLSMCAPRTDLTQGSMGNLKNQILVTEPVQLAG